MRPAAILAALAAVLCAGCAGAATPSPPIRIGAIFPLTGSASSLATEEYEGALAAVQLVNQAGGVRGRAVQLDMRNVPTAAGVRAAADSLRSDGVTVVLGAYSSELSIPAAAAVARDSMVYWETGAVADQLTGQGLPLVFRVGADGADLGGNSARFAVQQLAPRLSLDPVRLRVYLVTADDAYAHSVAGGARRGLRNAGVSSLHESTYNPYRPLWAPVLRGIASAHPDVVMLSAHIPDGIAFRRALLAARLNVAAFIGTTMAQCVPSFGRELGAAAYGVFASDRPGGSFNAAALSPAARELFARFSDVWRQRTGSAPDEEGIAGFSATWALLHDVLPSAPKLSAASVAAAARALDLPAGTLPDGAGIRFATDPQRLGQNLRAGAVVEEWQPTGEHTVWPATYADAPLTLTPVSA